MTTSPDTNTVVPVIVEKEKIIFEIKPVMLPIILNFENLVIIGFVVLAVIASVVFRFGIWEIIIVAAVFLLLTVPSLRTIFLAGSTTYVLTNRRLVVFTGMGVKEKTISLDQIQSAKCKSSGLQRFYRAGDILVKQKGLRGTLRMVGLIDCKRRADQIMQAVRKYAGN